MSIVSKDCNNGFSFIIGLALGAIAGILFAPRSGKETRALLKQTAEEHQDIIEKTKENVEHLIDDVSKKIDEKIQKIEPVEEEKITKKRKK